MLSVAWKLLLANYNKKNGCSKQCKWLEKVSMAKKKKKACRISSVCDFS